MADLVFNPYLWLGVIAVCLILMFTVSRYDNFKRKRKRKRWYTEEDMRACFEAARYWHIYKEQYFYTNFDYYIAKEVESGKKEDKPKT